MARTEVKLHETFPFWEQDELWMSKYGDVHKIEELESSHQRNIIGWMERRKFQYAVWKSHQLMTMSCLLNGQMNQDLIDSQYHRLADYSFFDQLPLVRRLRELTDGTD